METSSIILIAFLIDSLIGDPQYRLHPVRLIGKGIELCLRLLKRIGIKGRGAGILLTLFMIIASVGSYGIIHFALKDIFNHIIPVTKALESGDLPAARRAVGLVVGRDVISLDRSGVTRAAVETLAENFVDGFLSPVFWYVAGCVSGSLAGFDPVFCGISVMIIFKGASTLDSMVGHKNEEFLNIGWMGARLDDTMNYIPARLSLVILVIGSWFGPFHSIDGVRVALRDRLKHESPNSSHPESFVAGVLNIRLAGPIKYSEGIKDYPWLGAEYGDPCLGHIVMSMRLIMVSSWIAIIIACVILF